MKEVLIYTDGSARGNPGPGGYGVVLISGEHKKELCGGYKKTTNNRMELFAVISGLEALNQACKITVISDSKYVVNAMNLGWLMNWKSNGWAKKQKQPLKNADLWKRLHQATTTHDISWKWVKGHAGNIMNERCDQLATHSAQKPNLPVDQGYEDQSTPNLFGEE